MSVAGQEVRPEDVDPSAYGVSQQQYAILMPVSVMPREAVYSVYLEAQKRAVQASIAYLAGVAPQRIIVRQLRPEDLGLPGPSWTFRVRQGRQVLIDGAAPGDSVFTIFGFYNQSQAPKVVQLELWVGSLRRLLVNLQELYTRGYDPIGVLINVETVRPGEKVKVIALSRGEGDEELGVLGYVGEPEGKNVSRAP